MTCIVVVFSQVPLPEPVIIIVRIIIIIIIITVITTTTCIGIVLTRCILFLYSWCYVSGDLLVL